MPSGDARLFAHPLAAAALLPAPRANAAWDAWQNDPAREPLDPSLWRILPLLHARLAGSGADLSPASSPEGASLVARARAAFEQTRYRNALLLDEAAAAVCALRRAGVETCLLKGAALVAAVYRDPALRPMSDADLLVRPKDALRAIEVLIAEGWNTPRPLGPLEIARFHAAPFTNAAHGSIDLHWRPLDARFEDGGDDALWAASRAGALAGEPCRVPAPSDLLLHACVGGQRFEGEAAWRWLADARAVLVRAEAVPDWGRLEAEAMRCGESETVADALSDLRDALEAPVPDGFVERLRAAPLPVTRRLAARARRRRPDARGLVLVAALHLETWRDLAARGAVPPGLRGAARSVAFAWGDVAVRDLPREALSRVARRLRRVVVGKTGTRDAAPRDGVVPPLRERA